MRVLLQRVRSAAVLVDGAEVGRIGPGLVALVGVTHDDRHETAERLADKVLGLRIFAGDGDGEGVGASGPERSVLDVGGEVLVVSQFTLYGDATRGRRPSWVAAARPEHAEPLVDHLAERLRAGGVTVATGRFGADMAVELVNDGPFTVMLER